MKNSLKKGFTLVELLVVITILSIISVVAYQSFSGATSSAVSARKLSDVTTIESSLQQYKITNNNYPKVDEYDSSKTDEKLWAYKDTSATASNTLEIAATDMDGDTIKSFTVGTSTASGGGRVLGIDKYATVQIAAKGTISQDRLGKQFLTKDLYDPELGDTPVGSKKLVDYGIGRYVYAVYKKPVGDETNGFEEKWGSNQAGSYYNIAYTIKKEETDSYETVITGDYDSESCKGITTSCPESLIGSGSDVLTNKKPQTSSTTTASNQGIPYPLVNYTK